MDTATIFTVIGTGIGVVTLMYTFLRNLKIDLYSRIDNVDIRIDKLDAKIDKIKCDLEAKIDKLDAKIDKVEHSLTSKIDKLDEKTTDIDRRMCRMEGAFSSKEFCYLKHEKITREAE